MKNLFLDTNVLIDFLANRKPFAEPAAILFTWGLEKKIKIYCSAISFNNIYYILRQTLSHKPTIKLLKELSGLIEIIAASEMVIIEALQSEFKDFEDAIQYYSALSIPGMDGIITRNTKDFSKSLLPVLTPREALVL